MFIDLSIFDQMSEQLIDTSLFQEPEDFVRPPPEHHFTTYRREGDKEPSEVILRLVGHSPLWGHLLWNAGIYTANFLEKNAEALVRGKRILELGAAAGLPSLVCALNGAEKVVSTDYPDPELISNVQYNFSICKAIDSKKVSAKGYIWGADVRTLVFDDEDVPDLEETQKFDLIILSDLIFNHTEHRKLLKTCRDSLKKSGKCLVVFTPHRPRVIHKDLNFFTLCEEFQLKSLHIETTHWSPMFQEEEETSEIRSRVYSYYLLPQWQ